MTSFRQIEANRRNARKSTGPTTVDGKQRSRCNAVRHGLTAETVIGALEDAGDYKAFEAAIIADYDAQSAVERELVLRLASLLWRLRRARRWKPAYLRSRPTIWLGSSSPAKLARHLARLSMHCSDGPKRSVSTAIWLHMGSRTKPKPYLIRCPNLLNLPSILPQSSRVASCVSPICLTACSTA